MSTSSVWQIQGDSILKISLKWNYYDEQSIIPALIMGLHGGRRKKELEDTARKMPEDA